MILLLLFSGVAQPALAQDGGGGEPDPVAVELWQRLETLVVSVLDDDDGTLDEATCLTELVQAQLEREEALGLVPDARDPALVSQRRNRAREGVRTFVRGLIERGDQVEAIEISRIREFDASEAEETLVADGQQPLPITAAGTLGVEMLDLPRPVDLSVYRLGADRWCFDPLSIPGP